MTDDLKAAADRHRIPGWNSIDLEHDEGAKVGEVAWPTDTEIVRMGDVFIPRRVEVSMPGGADQPSLAFSIEVRQGVPSFTRVEITSTENGRSVIGQDLKIVRGAMLYWLDDIVTLVAEQHERDEEDGPSWADPKAVQQSLSAVRKRKRDRPLHDSGRQRRQITPEFLTRIAELYRANVEGKPIEAICSAYGAKYRTAARWVELCRSDQYQLLPKTAPGKKKA